MSCVLNAKYRVRSRATSVALAVIPLAMMIAALPARGESVTFNPGICMADYGHGGTCTIALLGEGGNPDANQVEVYTQNPYASSAVSSQNDREIELTFQGSGSGSFDTPETVPVSWDFDITNRHSGTTVSWNLLFEIFTSGNSPSTESISGSVGSSSTAQEISGAGDISGVSGSVTGWEIQLTATSSTPQDTFSLNIPGGATLNLNSPTPEPSTLFLAGAGLAGLMFKKRTKTLWRNRANPKAKRPSEVC